MIVHSIPKKQALPSISACIVASVSAKESGPEMRTTADPALTNDRLAVGGDFMAHRANTVPDSDSQEFAATARALVLAAADLFGIRATQVTGETRETAPCQARFAVMLALRRLGWSFPRIARAVGRSDHTTAMHGVRRAEQLERREPGFCLAVSLLEGLAA